MNDFIRKSNIHNQKYFDHEKDLCLICKIILYVIAHIRYTINNKEVESIYVNYGALGTHQNLDQS